jgi:hypothetical protein
VHIGINGMTLVEKRNRSHIPDIAPDLLDQGIAQLSLESQIINDWLSNLDPSELQTRKAYEDMLRSRVEMLETLQYQRSLVRKTADTPANDALS